MAEFEVSPMLAQVLFARQLRRHHLEPVLTLTPNAGLLEAAQRLVVAIKAGKRIRIHGDYDADGVSATATLVWGLREVGANVHGFIPHRLNEGYGVHPDRVTEHAEAADVLVTVDCGVTNLEEVRSLLSLGVEVIVTDHHSPGPDFPKCLVVHPKLTQDYDPALHNLTGAGVAYHLLWAIYNELGLPAPLHLTPLATLGTVADVAPLVGENRALVVAGLAEFERTELPGVRALMNGKKTVTARDVGFVLAPRINAAGRMGEAEVALELLTTTHKLEAEKIAIYLEIKNAERRVIQDKMFKEALTLADPEDPALVITHDDWHPGVMGIVASKLLEAHYKPVYIVAQGKGSVRSTPGISAVQGLYYSAPLLKRFGGHPGAAGFSLEMDNFAAFRDSIHAYARQFPRPLPSVRLDALLPAACADLDFAAEIRRFEPFGEGHRPPLWHLRDTLESAKLIGQDKKTLSFKVGGVRGIKYSEGRTRSGPHDFAINLNRNEWNGRENAEFFGEALRSPAALSLAGEPDTGLLLERLDPKTAMGHLKTGAAVYASGEVAAYLQSNVPSLMLLADAADLPGAEFTSEVVLYALPPEDTLRRWLAQGKVSFAWGPKTLGELEGHTLGRRAVLSGLDYTEPGARERAAEIYRRLQWAHLYRSLDDEGFSRAVRAMLDLRVNLAAGDQTEAKDKTWAAD
ncbi:single-stranded-DNA-specific exonuclease RecJ [Deinococcus detaillensis]|uniref:Single-stranded-DNA-specific exonuclease RecJ n=1 Tax=Deinococcus detaillensis TaxID=2592048 RepID=A0A553V6U1_9DEIO|nr:DHH family phosphoesterase [Deinococcus detaillensis]TSA88188.1 single-stranded-DNA-specific exonuclease RecJ [Deinococcus detaillensis]